VSHAVPPAWRLQAHAVLGSTQDVALAAAEAGDPGRLAVMAARQTEGRGSRGRGWTAPAGNLNLSVLLRPERAAPEPGRWALLAGVALHAVLSAHVAGGLMLKWPNDVLLNGGKLAGILIDAHLGADGYVTWVVIGMGANLAEAPHIEGRACACLPPPAPPAEEIIAALLPALDLYDALPTAEICAAWLARAHGVGTMLDVVTPSRRIAGRFAGLTARGDLMLAGEAAPISAGEVFLREGLLF
jgi:BirA family biotin operon repressor/biotin-[acetyl-CoA-carboxylase] ligase